MYIAECYVYRRVIDVYCGVNVYLGVIDVYLGVIYVHRGDLYAYRGVFMYTAELLLYTAELLFVYHIKSYDHSPNVQSEPEECVHLSRG
jgi:hypothetical protein